MIQFQQICEAHKQIEMARENTQQHLVMLLNDMIDRASNGEFISDINRGRMSALIEIYTSLLDIEGYGMGLSMVLQDEFYRPDDIIKLANNLNATVGDLR